MVFEDSLMVEFVAGGSEAGMIELVGGGSVAGTFKPLELVRSP